MAAETVSQGPDRRQDDLTERWPPCEACLRMFATLVHVTETERRGRYLCEACAESAPAAGEITPARGLALLEYETRSEHGWIRLDDRVFDRWIATCELSYSAFRLLAAIYRDCEYTRRSTSQTALAQRAGISRRGVARELQRLVDLGLVHTLPVVGHGTRVLVVREGAPRGRAPVGCLYACPPEHVRQVVIHRSQLDPRAGSEVVIPRSQLVGSGDHNSCDPQITTPPTDTFVHKKKVEERTSTASRAGARARGSTAPPDAPDATRRRRDLGAQLRQRWGAGYDPAWLDRSLAELVAHPDQPTLEELAAYFLEKERDEDVGAAKAPLAVCFLRHRFDPWLAARRRRERRRRSDRTTTEPEEREAMPAAAAARLAELGLLRVVK